MCALLLVDANETRRNANVAVMAPIVDQKALEDFIDHADLDEVRRAEAALTAMAASVRLRAVELETQQPAASTPGSAHAG